MPTDGISAANGGTETSVRRRFLGSSRTKHCLTIHYIGTLPVWRLSKIAHFAAIALASCPQLADTVQKSEVAGRRIFRETTKREAIAGSYSLTRVTEVACEFNVRR